MYGHTPIYILNFITSNWKIKLAGRWNSLKAISKPPFNICKIIKVLGKSYLILFSLNWKNSNYSYTPCCSQPIVINILHLFFHVLIYWSLCKSEFNMMQKHQIGKVPLCIWWEQFTHTSLIISLHLCVYCNFLAYFMNKRRRHIKVLW